MKNLLYYVLMGLILIIVFTRCKNDSGGDANHLQKRDTTAVYGIYKVDSVNVSASEMRRVRYQALIPSEKDSMKNEWKIDTLYLVVKRMPVDTALSNEYFKQRGIRVWPKDSTGSQNYLPFEYIYNKRLVRSGWENLDSAISELKREKL